MRMFRMCDCEHARRRGGRGDGKQAQQTTDMDRYGRADTTTADFSVTVYELIRHQGTYIARSLLPFHATDAIAILLHTHSHKGSGVPVGFTARRNRG